MKRIKDELRTVANIKTDGFVPFLSEDGEMDGEVLQVNGGKTGYGFHVYRMLPGQRTIPHRHVGDEEFFVLEGDLRDHDGYEYKPGDLVCLKAGSEHYSISDNGCLLVVYLRGVDGF
ncbi:cupin domain-containing protein [Rhodobacteraceae bacterium B1Z28]|uniref:Cupin domain-containing protein n=1 Tax=Ruegeria haliotis TaxID=2747601 RepID=A0ABX2PWE0_9RHOB|nr:cupin domain-containing protein [Ruegeria haliotis]NVO58466.1 cupin domain-containing protein [Ruegeria haliotis]